jgi:hypothetical protein
VILIIQGTYILARMAIHDHEDLELNMLSISKQQTDKAVRASSLKPTGKYAETPGSRHSVSMQW